LLTMKVELIDWHLRGEWYRRLTNRGKLSSDSLSTTRECLGDSWCRIRTPTVQFPWRSVLIGISVEDCGCQIVNLWLLKLGRFGVERVRRNHRILNKQ